MSGLPIDDKFAQPEEVAEMIRNAKPLPPEFPRVNLYVCKKCGFKLHTVDVAYGTTSMILPCMVHIESRIELLDGGKATHCDGQMFSCFYAVDPDNLGVDLSEVKFEWRFATLPQYREYRKRNSALADHVANGGLILSRRSNKNAPMFTHGNFFVRPDGSRLSDGEAESLQTGLQVLKETIRLDMGKAKRAGHERMLRTHKARKKRKGKG